MLNFPVHTGSKVHISIFEQTDHCVAIGSSRKAAKWCLLWLRNIKILTFINSEVWGKCKIFGADVFNLESSNFDWKVWKDYCLGFDLWKGHMEQSWMQMNLHKPDVLLFFILPLSLIFFFFYIFLWQISMSVRQRKPTALTAATTRWAPSPVCVTLPMSWGLMGNSATVSTKALYIYNLH